MMPVGPLMIEHRLIMRMARVIDRLRKGIVRDATVDLGAVDAVVAFIRTYADRCHHGKEEDILFRRCREKALSPELAQTMQRLLDEHVQGRALVARLVEAGGRHRRGEDGAVAEVAALLGEIAAFYERHIGTEDERFFVAVMDYFSKAERDELYDACLRFDQRFVHERYRELTETMEAQT